MQICVIGTGYVGLVAGICFSDTGQRVICVDVDEDKIRQLSSGKLPLYEPGLAELLDRNLKAERLTFSTDLAEATRRADIIFIAVGTPPAPDGSVDMSQVMNVAESIAKHAQDRKILVMKSTVPVGTYSVISDLLKKTAKVSIDYVSNPEFLKEGNAIEDFTKPDRVIIGSGNSEAAQAVAHLYLPFMRQTNRLILTDPASAELAKYAANTMLATRITFMNEMARLCDQYGANVEDVRRCVGSDRRIGTAFLFPGLGYGGFCFPKDVQALVSMGQQRKCPMRIAEATHQANSHQVEYFKGLIDQHFQGRYKDKRIAVWGLAYKARTDDVRRSPAMHIVRWLIEQGAGVAAHDPQAMARARGELGESVAFSDSMYDVLQDADGLLVLTDWQEFRNPDFDQVKALLREHVIIEIV